jgi:hypothetical protein
MMDTTTLGRHVMDAVLAALDGDPYAGADALTAIYETRDPHDMYAACCGFANIAYRAMMKSFGMTEAPKGSFWGVQVLKDTAFKDDPCGAFASRFIAAYANDDNDTTFALFKAAVEVGPEHFVDCVSRLVSDTAGIHRTAMEEASDGSTP